MNGATLRLVCMLAMLGVLLAACGEGPGPQAPFVQETKTPVSPGPSASSTPPPAQPAKSPEAGRKVTIYRDSWGVPHIFADTLGDAAYGQGYVQAEDRLNDLYANIRMATGTMAEAFGEKYVMQDYLMKVVKNVERMETFWQTAPEHLKALGDNFMRGAQQFVDEHPEKKPEFATELHGWQCAAIGRTMILNWPLGTIQDDLRHKKEAPPFGSNGWVVGPGRSAEGCPILLADPHLTWEGMSVFYEARVHTSEIELSGFFLVGSPLLAIGHSAHVAWACTTGGPDTSDVYMLKLNPQNPLQYEYDGQWRDIQVVSIRINVKDKGTVEKPAAYTHLGPLFEEPDLEKGIAYAGASPYLEHTGLFEEMYCMNTAKSCDEFYAALGMNQFMEQNLIFADTAGTIQYVRTGATPIRPDGYNWSAPVPGNTSATAWKGIHDIADLVQVKNPPQGYFENCNVSPRVMMKDSPMTPEKYKDYIYNVSWDKQNPRSKRAVQLLDSDSSVTKEEAMAIAFDVFDILAAPWQQALKAAAESDTSGKAKEPEVAKAVESVLAWNGEYAADSTAAPIMRFWRLKCADNSVDCAAIAEGKDLSAEQQAQMVDLLAQTVADMKQRFGSLDVTLGTIQKVGREGRLFPAPGADFGGGAAFTETLFDVKGKEQPDGSFIAHSGSMATQLVFLRKDGIESYTCTPWGQSADPNSPHHVDQGEKLYSTRTFKPTWFKKEALMEHVESEKTLTIP